MPYLQIDFGGTLDPDTKRRFAEAVAELYGDQMETSTGHAAVTVRTHDREAVMLGRAGEGPTLVLDADIRQGRSFERKREFALEVIDLAAEQLDVPEANAKVVFTEHEGENMMGADRVGDEWEDDG